MIDVGKWSEQSGTDTKGNGEDNTNWKVDDVAYKGIQFD